MRIVHVVPGSGGTFYCENCLRDSVAARALRALGEDAIIVPMYLPIYHDGAAGGGDAPVFFGAINTYLQQHLGLFRKTPRWLDRLLDAPGLLRMAGRRAGSTSASGLGAMTLSMMRGIEGNQAKEVRRLIGWLRDEARPDLVQISNALLIGLARSIRDQLEVPIVCGLQDEDGWLDGLDAPYGDRCWEEVSARVGDVDAFVAASEFYGAVMARRLGIPSERMRVVYPGVDLGGYPRSRLDLDPPVIGYLSRMTPSLGLEALVAAFIELRRRPGLERLRLRAMGGQVGEDRAFVEGLRRRLAGAGLESDAEFLEELDRPARTAFLSSLSILSLPATHGAAFGLPLVEAWACGVPVVQPQVGAYTELVERTGGGVLYDPADPGALVDALGDLLGDPSRLRALGESGFSASRDLFDSSAMAGRLVEIYESILPGGPA